MPVKKEVYASYWAVCVWGIFPYPCKKWRKEMQWCYNFTRGESSCYGFVEFLKACEGGKQYEWTAPCFGKFGSAKLSGFQKCSVTPLKETGNCVIG